MLPWVRSRHRPILIPRILSTGANKSVLFSFAKVAGDTDSSSEGPGHDWETGSNLECLLKKASNYLYLIKKNGLLLIYSSQSFYDYLKCND